MIRIVNGHIRVCGVHEIIFRRLLKLLRIDMHELERRLATPSKEWLEDHQPK